MRVGIDIVEISRVSLEDNFIKRFANEQERSYIDLFATVNGGKERLAGLWCVKEAVMKALGTDLDQGITMHDIELCHEGNGRPYVKLYGEAEKKFKELKLTEIEVSISHSVTVATAICVIK